MKIRCSNCRDEKDELLFSWKIKEKKRQSKCKVCTREYAAQHYRNNKRVYIKRARKHDSCYLSRNRKYIVEYLMSHPCVDCGESDIRTLDFDHIRGKKTQNVSVLVRRRHSLFSIKKEISKCDVRCANCHRKRTSLVGDSCKETYF